MRRKKKPNVVPPTRDEDEVAESHPSAALRAGFLAKAARNGAPRGWKGAAEKQIPFDFAQGTFLRGLRLFRNDKI